MSMQSKAPGLYRLLSSSVEPKVSHIPVLLEPLARYLQEHISPASVIVDATFGAGGYSRRCLELGHRVIAMDQDECAATLASKLEHPNFKFMRGNFSNMNSALESLGVKEPDAVLFDIGFSSMQIDDPARGFSFMRDGPLDMRMDQTQSLTAADIINWYPEIELAKIFLEFGEELNGGAIARAIVVERQKRPIKRTGQLASLVERINFSYKTRTSHPATRTFQALRIVVNDEIRNLKIGLTQAISLLRVGGILAVATFHALEDKIVKDIYRQQYKHTNFNEVLISF